MSYLAHAKIAFQGGPTPPTPRTHRTPTPRTSKLRSCTALAASSYCEFARTIHEILLVEKLGWRAWIVHTKLYGRSDYLSTFCSGSFGHAKPTTQGVQYNEECRFSIQQR